MPAPPPTVRQPQSIGAAVLPALTLWQRELVRFFRQPHRVISAVLTPIVLWTLLGSGMDSALVFEGIGPRPLGFRQYFFTGTLTMILLFTSIFSTITVIEDRREGFLQGVLVAPVGRFAIVLGKVLGGTSICMIHALVFLLLWPLAAPWPGAAEAMTRLAGAAGVSVIVAMLMTSLGLCIAWPMTSTAGFHALMMLVLMPMWFLSGALFPLVTAPFWLRVLMWCNPLTYGHEALAGVLGSSAADTPLSVPVSITATTALCAAALVGAAAVVRPRRTAGG